MKKKKNRIASAYRSSSTKRVLWHSHEENRRSNNIKLGLHNQASAIRKHNAQLLTHIGCDTDPSNRAIDLFDQQLDLTNPTQIRPCHNLSPLSIDRKTIQRLHSVAALTRHRQTTRLAQDIEREDSTGPEHVILYDATLVIVRVRVTHAFVHQRALVAGRDPRFGLEMLVQRRDHLNVVRCVLDELRHERSAEPYSRPVCLVHRDDLR